MALEKAMKNAERNAKLRDAQRLGEVQEAKNHIQSLLGELGELTGEDLGIYRRKGQNTKVRFAQMIVPNIEFLRKHRYLTQAEESFLFNIGGLLEFGSNVIIEKETAKTKRDKFNQEGDDFSEATPNATITYIAEYLGLLRKNLSPTMNSLKEKGILATAETGMVTENGRVCTSRTWLVNPNIVYFGDKDNVEMGTQRIFSKSLNFIFDDNGKKVKLPIRLFL